MGNDQCSMTNDQTRSLTLEEAVPMANDLLDELKEFCEQIEIAGSIRRRRSVVNDIDIVALPKKDRLTALREYVLKQGSVTSEGLDVLIVKLANDVQLDLWLARPTSRDLFAETPTNYGSLMVCRTGSEEHNIWLCNEAKKLGRQWNPYRGVFEGEKLIASATEREIFAALEVPYINPHRRERP